MSCRPTPRAFVLFVMVSLIGMFYLTRVHTYPRQSYVTIISDFNTQFDVNTGHETNAMDSLADHETNVMDSPTDHETNVMDYLVDHETNAMDSLADHETNVMDSPTDHETNVMDYLVDHETNAMDSLADHETNVMDSPTDHETNAMDSLADHETNVMDSPTDHETNVMDYLVDHETNVMDSLTFDQYDLNSEPDALSFDEPINPNSDFGNVNSEVIEIREYVEPMIAVSIDEQKGSDYVDYEPSVVEYEMKSRDHTLNDVELPTTMQQPGESPHIKPDRVDHYQTTLEGVNGETPDAQGAPSFIGMDLTSQPSNVAAGVHLKYTTDTLEYLAEVATGADGLSEDVLVPSLYANSVANEADSGVIETEPDRSVTESIVAQAEDTVTSPPQAPLVRPVEHVSKPVEDAPMKCIKLIETLKPTKSATGVKPDTTDSAKKTIVWLDVVHDGNGLRNTISFANFDTCLGTASNCEILPHVIVVPTMADPMDTQVLEPIQADAVLVQGTHLIQIPKVVKRDENQVYVFVERENWFGTNSYENVVYKSKFAALKKNMNIFNWTMTYRLDSDILFPYGHIVRKQNPPIFTPGHYESIYRAKKFEVVWFVSHCKTNSMREDYVRKLQKYVDVHIYGACGKHSCPKNDDNCIARIVNEYKFVLSFENTYYPNYVTEKLFSWFPKHIIQVVRGGGIDYSIYGLPDGSVIDADAFFSVQKLANVIKRVGSSSSEYISYLKKKDGYKGIPMDFIQEQAYCNLCAKLQDVNKSRKSYNHIAAWFNANIFQDKFCPKDSGIAFH